MTGPDMSEKGSSGSIFGASALFWPIFNPQMVPTWTILAAPGRSQERPEAPQRVPGDVLWPQGSPGKVSGPVLERFPCPGEALGTTFDRFRTGLFFAQNYCEPAPGRSVVFHPMATFYDWLALGLTPFCPHLPKCVDLCAEHPPRPWPPVAPFSIDILDQIS